MDIGIDIDTDIQRYKDINVDRSGASKFRPFQSL